MKILLHACCGPCSIKCIEMLREEGLRLDLFWYNPNIHPYTEYRSRRDTLAGYAKDLGLEMILVDEYGLRPFVKAVAPDIENRCGHCYRIRLETAARYAAEHGYDGFTTTLHVSPYQNQEQIRAVGEEMGALHGVSYLYRDFSERFREGQREGRGRGL